jgi:hypothetical protein
VALLLIFIVTFALPGNTEEAPFASGTGTVEDPYIIINAEQLNEVRNYVTSHFRLGADIDLSVYGEVYDDGKGWLPIGTGADLFQGSFSGKNGSNYYKITNLYINRPETDSVGLFNAAGATIEDFTLEGTNITGRAAVGALTGYSSNCQISNIFVQGTIKGRRTVGGVAGFVTGSNMAGLQADVEVKHYSNDERVTAWAHIGGLVATLNNSSTLSHSSAMGSVTSTVSFNYSLGVSAGGLVGSMGDQSRVDNSYAGNTVSAAGDRVGGLIGTVDNSQIWNSHAWGEVTGRNTVGGLIGYLEQNVDSRPARVVNSYAAGAVAGGFDAGGLVGFLQGGASVEESYYDNQVSGMSDPKGTPRSTMEMKFAETFAGWDFDSTWAVRVGTDRTYPYLRDVNYQVYPGRVTTGNIGGTVTLLSDGMPFPEAEVNVWHEGGILPVTAISNIEGGYLLEGMPVGSYSSLKANKSGYFEEVAENINVASGETAVQDFALQLIFNQGTGTLEDPFMIATADQLNHARNYLSSHFQLASDIDLTGYGASYDGGQGWLPIGNDNPFTGTFNGAGKTISNLYIDRDTMTGVGLFSVIKDAGIYNLNLEGVSVTGQWYVGTIIGEAINSEIEKITVAGSVAGLRYIGGIVGYDSYSLLKDLKSQVQVTGELNYIGGLVGEVYGSHINNSLSTATVTGRDDVGGLVGYAYEAEIAGSHSTATVTGEHKVGGLVGIMSSGKVPSQINNSHAAGDVSGKYKVGGLVGYMSGWKFGEVPSQINNSHAAGDVSGEYEVGGLAGSAGYTFINNSFAVGNVSGTGDFIGGLVGYEPSATYITSSYYRSDQPQNGFGEPKTNEDLQKQSTFTGWDFCAIWLIQEDLTHPYLSWQLYPNLENPTAGTVSTAYSHSFTATGGTTPYGFAVTAGSLPAGLTLSEGGVLSGTPATAGTFTYTVTVTDGAAATMSHVFTHVINPPGLAVNTANPAAGTVGTPYSHTFIATGGTTPYSFTVTADSLPAGLTLSDGGVLSGTPATAGTFTYTVTVTDGASATVNYSFTHVINYPPGPDDGGSTPSTGSQLTQKTTATVDGRTVETFTVLYTAALQQINSARSAGSETFEINMDSSTTATSVVNIPAVVMNRAVGMNILVSTPNATLMLPKALISALAIVGQDLSITVERGDTEIVANLMSDSLNMAGAEVVGMPTTINTAITGSTTVTLPLTGISIPADAPARAAFLNNLAIFAIHSDGEKKVIEGTITYDASANPTGISFQVEKFSTFAVIKLPPKTIRLTIGKADATVEGHPYTLEAVPFINPKANRTMVPLRFISEALGAQVEWRAETRQVVIKDENTEIVLTIGSNRFTVNGTPVTVDSPSELVPPGRTFVPLRFISETLSAQVDWDAATNTVSIYR